MEQTDIALNRKFEDELDEKISNNIFPAIIYKFRVWNDQPNDHIIRKKTIKLASPQEMLADYPEAYLPIDESLITEEYLQKVAFHTAKLQYPNHNYAWIHKVAQELRLTMKIEDEQHRKDTEVYSKIRNDETLGIFCATTNFQDLYLWQNFGDSGFGFTVGLDTRKIVLHPHIYGSAGLVDYYPDTNPPKVPPFSFSDKELLYKSMMQIFNIPDRYEQEKEFRIVRINREKDIDGRVAKYKEYDRIIRLGTDCYKEIVLGYNIKPNDQKEIIYTRDRILNDVPIYTSKIEDGKIIKVDKI